MGVLLTLAWGVSTNLLSDIVPMSRQFWPVLFVVIGLLVGCMTWAQRGGTGPPMDVDLDRLADDLADTVAGMLRDEEEDRRITQPAPLPVRWHSACDDLADHPSNVNRTAVGLESPTLEVADRLEEIVAVYERITSGLHASS